MCRSVLSVLRTCHVAMVPKRNEHALLDSILVSCHQCLRSLQVRAMSSVEPWRLLWDSGTHEFSRMLCRPNILERQVMLCYEQYSSTPHGRVRQTPPTCTQHARRALRACARWAFRFRFRMRATHRAHLLGGHLGLVSG